MATVIDVRDAGVRRGHNWILDHVTWAVDDHERWVIIGPNGAGKTTLVQLISARLFPTTGTVTLCGATMGRIDVFELRPRIGVASAALDDQIPPAELVEDFVMSAAYAVFGRWRETYSPVDKARARTLLSQLRIEQLAKRRIGTLSEGEKQRALIARALMTDPEVLVLDEPTAGLDLAGRELLMGTLSDLMADWHSPAIILVTHHTEDIPAGITHGLFLKQGRVVTAGPLRAVMTDETLSRTFDLPLYVRPVDGRWHAQSNRA